MSRPLAHWLLLLALVAMWGSAFMLTGIAVRAFSPAALVTVRLAIAAVLLTALALVSGLRFPRDRRFWLSSIALAVVGNCLPFWLISFGQQRIDSGLAGILMGIMPLTVMVLAHFLVADERLNVTKAMGFLLGFAGLVLLIGPKALLELRGQGTDLLYELAVLGGAVCYAINTILARHRPPADALVAAAGMMLMGSAVMLPIGTPGALTELPVAPGLPLAALIGLGVTATAIPTVVFLKLVVVAGPSFTSFINYLIPVWALLMGMLFLGERPAPTVLLALAMILGGIALSEVGSRRIMARQAGQGT
jgi:drug/metabolite transporter (DMT)-like permease